MLTQITSAVDVVGPPGLSHYEQERGKPMPTVNHAFVQTRLIIAFASAAEYSVLSEVTLELPDGERMTPDIAAFPRLVPDWRHDTRMKTMPRMVVEIVSPRQGSKVIMDKLDVYFAHGVESVWLVEPSAQTIFVYQPGVARPLVFAAGEARDPATGLAVQVEALFA